MTPKEWVLFIGGAVAGAAIGIMLMCVIVVGSQSDKRRAMDYPECDDPRR